MRILTLESLIFVTGGVGDRGNPPDRRLPQLVEQLKQQQPQPYRPVSPYFNFWK